jgi:radical SAM superfamily enzyme YgiQ (UPF0313 family)
VADVVLATLNAKWIHASFGLRCLRANLGELRERSVLLEFTIDERPADVVERLLAAEPRIVGLGVYVWNALPMRQVVEVLKRVRPDVVVVLGGPEVSHETGEQPICALADHVVRGEADLAFADLCRRVLAGERPPRVVDAPLPHLDRLASPYGEYTDEDIRHRVVYVEASRGCPFTCEFCLSSLDVPVRQAPLDAFLGDLQVPLDRGLLHFKFVDRTFNLGIPTATRILRFFRERARPGLFLHFELIPDRLPEALRDEIARLPAGSVQFEVGIQTFDPATSERISRRQDVGRLEANLRWLAEHTGAHVHADLIVGLPGEDVATFARGFDRLVALRPQEIQVGILKRLRGTPIVRHDAEHGMLWSSEPPYDVLATAAVPFEAMQRLKRFARYWDVVANSGNWRCTLERLLAGDSAFHAFDAFAAWLWAETRATSGIALPRLAGLMWRWLVDERGDAAAAVASAMLADYRRCGRSDVPAFLAQHADEGAVVARRVERPARTIARRQARHRG